MRISMPRSPRATITQSAARMISSMRSTACGFSILAISGRRVCLRRDVTSSARRTKRQRDEVDADPLAGAQVVEVLLGHGRQRGDLAGDVERPGARRPRRRSRPPRRTRRRRAAIAVTRRRTAPSARYMISLGVDGVGEPGPRDVHAPRVALGRVLAAHEGRSSSPGLSSAIAVAQRADAQLRARAGPAAPRPGGPRGRRRRARARPSRRAPRRCRGRSSAGRRPCPPRPCRTRTSGSREAGPMVATILVRRRISPHELNWRSSARLRVTRLVAGAHGDAAAGSAAGSHPRSTTGQRERRERFGLVANLRTRVQQPVTAASLLDGPPTVIRKRAVGARLEALDDLVAPAREPRA